MGTNLPILKMFALKASQTGAFVLNYILIQEFITRSTGKRATMQMGQVQMCKIASAKLVCSFKIWTNIRIIIRSLILGPRGKQKSNNE